MYVIVSGQSVGWSLRFAFEILWPCCRGIWAFWSLPKWQEEFEVSSCGPLGTRAQKVQNGVKNESKSTIFWGAQKGGFSKGWFWRCSPATKTGTRSRSDVPRDEKLERGYVRMFPRNENRNEGTFPKTTLLRNRPFISWWHFSTHLTRVHAYGGVRQHSVLRRVLRRFWTGFWGTLLRRVLRRGSAIGCTIKRVLRRVLRRGSEKGVSRRCLERPLVEYAPLGVRPIDSFSTPLWTFGHPPRAERPSLRIFWG